MRERPADQTASRLESGGWIRIGELSRRVGVSPHVIRAWERRYSLLCPQRTAGGFRLYSRADEARLRAMTELVAGGTSAALAARQVAEQVEPARTSSATGAQATALTWAPLEAALERFDEEAAHRELDEIFAARTQDSAIRDFLLPCLRDLGERWARGEITIAQEHFATALVRGRLLGLTRGWASGRGPRALLACLPQERHDLGLLCFGLTLRRRGWRITFLGADTPLETVVEASHALEPVLVALAAATRERFAPLLARRVAFDAPMRLAIGGPGASLELAEQIGAELLADDPVEAAIAIGSAP